MIRRTGSAVPCASCRTVGHVGIISAVGDAASGVPQSPAPRGMVALLIYWGLLALLFDLEPFEAIATAFIIWVTRTVVLLAVASLLSV